eukprot:2974639-Pleurochrysis_carterae.AAC.2
MLRTHACTSARSKPARGRGGHSRAGSDARRSGRVQSLMPYKSSANCPGMPCVPSCWERGRSCWERGRACGITCAVT